MTVYRLWSLIMVAALLAACATRIPEPQEYLLDAPALSPRSAQPSDNRPTLEIDNVGLADFLTVSGIVLQTGPNQVHVAAGHRWAEPLARQLRRGLFHILSNRLSGVTVFEQPQPAITKAYRLSLSLDAFQGRYDGNALIAGTWRLENADGALLARQSFHVATPLSGNGYLALVQTLSQSWRETAAGIAAAAGRRIAADTQAER